MLPVQASGGQGRSGPAPDASRAPTSGVPAAQGGRPRNGLGSGGGRGYSGCGSSTGEGFNAINGSSSGEDSGGGTGSGGGGSSCGSSNCGAGCNGIASS